MQYVTYYANNNWGGIITFCKELFKALAISLCQNLIQNTHGYYVKLLFVHTPQHYTVVLVSSSSSCSVKLL